jgi:hypothetical protein
VSRHLKNRSPVSDQCLLIQISPIKLDEFL